MRRDRVVSQDLQRLNAVDAWQVDVHQHGIRLRDESNLDAAAAVPRGQQADIGPARKQRLDQGQIGQVVLDTEHGAQRRMPRNQRRGDCRRCACGGSLRLAHRIQFNPEFAAHTHCAVRANFAAHQFDQALADHQTDPGAFFGPSLLSEAIEGLEQLRKFFFGQAFARVAETDAHALRRDRAPRHFHHTARTVVFDGVGKQVDEDLLDPGPVGIDEMGVVQLRENHADIALVSLRLDHGLAVAQHFAQRHWFQRQRKLAGLDQRKVKDLVDQLQQIPPGLQDLVDAGLLRRRRQRRPRFHELSES